MLSTAEVHLPAFNRYFDCKTQLETAVKNRTGVVYGYNMVQWGTLLLSTNHVKNNLFSHHRSTMIHVTYWPHPKSARALPARAPQRSKTWICLFFGAKTRPPDSILSAVEAAAIDIDTWPRKTGNMSFSFFLCVLWIPSGWWFQPL